MTYLDTPRRPTVLYIDDNSEDHLLATAAANHAGTHFQLQCFPGILSAQDYLLGKGVFANRAHYPFPILVLTDYALGIDCGRDLVKWIRKQPPFESLPCIVFSDHQSEARYTECYAAGADHCVGKPLTLETSIELMKCLSRCLSVQPPHYAELVKWPGYQHRT